MPEYILIFLIGLTIGAIISKLIWIRNAVFGALKIDRSNPEKDYISLEIDDLDSLFKNEKVILKITQK